MGPLITEKEGMLIFLKVRITLWQDVTQMQACFVKASGGLRFHFCISSATFCPEEETSEFQELQGMKLENSSPPTWEHSHYWN